MIDSTRLLPPVSGLSTDPILFGVSEGLARLLPLPEDDTFALLRPAVPGESPGPGPAPATPVVEAGPTA